MSGLVRAINNIGGKLFGKKYYKAAILLKLKLSGRRPPVLIWQMGKVGSSTIEKSLKQSGYNGAIFHVHVLSDALLEKGEAKKRAKNQGNVSYLYNQVLRETVLQNKHEWKIISLVREPVGRNISSFFQNIDVYFPDQAAKINQAESVETDSLINVFMEKFDHDRPLEWLDFEFSALVGINVYDKPFDVSAGYQLYANENYTALIIRMENLSEKGEDAMRRYLAFDAIRLAEANVGDSKSYSDKYNEVKKNIVFSPDYLNKMYNSTYARHFYSREEISLYREKWSNNIDEGC